MSKVELSDAELIATLKATAWHLSKRLTARNAELDELRKVVERVKHWSRAWLKKLRASQYLMIQALAPAQKEAPVERCEHTLNTTCQRCAPYGLCHQCKTGIATNAMGIPGTAPLCDECKKAFIVQWTKDHQQSTPHDPTAATEARNNDAFNIKRGCEVIVHCLGPVLTQIMLNKYLMPTILFVPLKAILAASARKE